MKLRNIFIAGLSLVALASCQESFLDVDAPSKNTHAYVFSEKVEMQRALNGVYTPMMSTDLFGEKIFTDFQLNSDVDFTSNGSASTSSNNYKRFDCDADGSQLSKTWNKLYEGVELANLFVEGVEGSPLYNAENPDADIVQMLGEAKVIRAIYYHELVWMFGDAPFSFNSSKTSDTKIYPIKDRLEILDLLIADLKSVADKMKSSSDATVERPNKEMAYGMIARLALTAGGYTLRPEGNTYGKMVRPANYKEYYTIARDYAKKAIDCGTHRLSKPYYKVFVDECNFIAAQGDDPMFEIPFGKASTGNIGYVQGPTLKSYNSLTNHNYGEASTSKAALNSFYRFMFDENDSRRDYINQLFYYDANASANPSKCGSGYSVANGKWSKLWVNGGLGSNTKGNTGINFPYMRYADVLLMFAEADNEVNGAPTPEAIAALEAVRTRAFGETAPEKIAQTSRYGSKEDFLKAVLDERKWEFAGENMRWRDLVRNNLYNIVTYYNFLRYREVAKDQAAGSDYLDEVSNFDFGEEGHYDKLPNPMYNIVDVVNEDFLPESAFPNRDVKICRILNPYKFMSTAEKNALGLKDVLEQHVYSDWGTEEYPYVKTEIQNSLRGYLYIDAQNGNSYIVDNGAAKIMPEPNTKISVETLPVLRYILPIPNTAIRRAHGEYKNQYGYN